ncbi:MAG: hypothetical protein ACPG4N_10930, partial [Gammaproteobacteria bacterium]
MALREDLEAREQHCHSPRDWIDLARDAFNAPQDAIYGAELLQRAELKCQSVEDYLDLARFAAHEGQDPAYAQDLYNHAESVAQTPEERLTLCRELVERDVNPEHCEALLEQTLRRSPDEQQLIQIADFTLHTLESAPLTRRAMNQLTSPLTEIGTFEELSRRILESGLEDLARMVFSAGSRLCFEMKDLIDYAERHWRLFNDGQGALAILGDAEADCQTTREFVDLAGAYRRLFQDHERVSELMELAIEYAIEPNDQLDLAEGYWRHLHDPAAAGHVYRGVLTDLHEPEQLLMLARHVADNLGDRALCRDMLARSAALTEQLSVVIECARGAHDMLGDDDHARILINDAASRFSTDADQATIIDAALELDLDDLAIEYLEKRLYGANLDSALDCIEVIHHRGLPMPLLRQAMNTARNGARTPEEFIQLSQLAVHRLNDNAFTRGLLESAEELSSDPEELEAVSLAVQSRFPGDEVWAERLRRAIAKRVANAEHYEQFREREKSARGTYAFIHLARSVSQQLGDNNLVRKLLIRAEMGLTESTPLLNDRLNLADAVAGLLGDADWIERLLEAAEPDTRTIADLSSVLDMAKRHLPGDIAHPLIEKYLHRWEERLSESNSTRYADYLKLARLTSRFALAKAESSSSRIEKLLDKAAALGKSAIE